MKKIILLTLAAITAVVLYNATVAAVPAQAQTNLLTYNQEPQYGERCVNSNQCARFERCTGYPGSPGFCVPK